MGTKMGQSKISSTLAGWRRAVVRHYKILYPVICLLFLAPAVSSCTGPTVVPTSPQVPAPPAPSTTMPTPLPTTPMPESMPTPFAPVVEPSPFSPWAESRVGPVYAQETHYVKPSPDGRYLYIYNMDTRNIIVLDLETRTIVENIKMPGFWAQANEMIFSSDGQRMFTLSAGQVGARHIVVIDTETKKIAHLIPLPKEYKAGFAPNGPFIAISPDEQFLYVSGISGIYRVNIESEQVTKISDIGRIVFLAFTAKGEHILGTNVATNSLDIIDPSSGRLVDSIPVGDSPQYILISPDGQRVYISNWESGDVSVVDLGERKVIATVPIGVNPLGMTITPNGSKLYVAVTAQALEHVEGKRPFKVVVVNTTTNTVVKEIMPGILGAPRFVNISPDGTKVYVNEYQGRIHIIDTSSDEVIDSILLARPAAYLPDDIAITPDGSKLLVYANGIHQVLVIDTATHALLTHFDAFSNAIAISSDGRRAYIPGFRFTVIDIPSLTARYVEMPDIGGGTSKVVLSKDERTAYITDAQRDILQVVDLENWRLIANVPVGKMGGAPEFGLAITPDGNKVFVCNGYSKDISVVSTAENKVIDTIKMESTPGSIDISPDGKVAYIIELQSDIRGLTHAVAIDVATHKVIQRWAHEPIGFGNPWEVAISPDGQHAYFAGFDGEIVVVLNIANGTTRYIDVGLDPSNLALTEDGRLLYVSNMNSDDITIIDTQTEMVVDIIPIQVNGTGFIYAKVTDSHGKSVEIDMRFVTCDRGIQGDFEPMGSAISQAKLDGYWIPVSEGDYMLWVNTNNREGMRLVSQIYNGISDERGLAQATRVRVKEGQITCVNFVLQDGHRVSGVLVDRYGAPVQSGGSIDDTKNDAAIRGCIGFGSDAKGHFSVVVPDGVYALSFNGVIVAKGVKVFQDVDLGKVIFSRQ